MNTNNQTYETKGLRFSYAKTLRKWTFTNGTFTLVQPCLGGQTIARKVAGQVNAALKRTNGVGLDSLGRGAIKHLTGY